MSKQLKKAHFEEITNLDKINNRDLLSSISADDTSLNVWNINNLECLFNLKKIYKEGKVSLNNSNDEAFFIDIYYDKELLKYCVVTGNERLCKNI